MGARSSKNTTQNNRSDGHLLEYFRNTFVRGGGGTNALTDGLTATGGVISDYTSGPAVYRAHIFTSTGTFTVSAPGTFGDTVEYLVVAGGGGGGADDGGGGGAGGFRTATSFPVNPGSFPAPFTVTAPGGYGDTVEYLVVAGGGGSNQAGGGGGGAGSQPDPLAVPGGNGGSGIVIIAYPS